MSEITTTTVRLPRVVAAYNPETKRMTTRTEAGESLVFAGDMTEAEMTEIAEAGRDASWAVAVEGVAADRMTAAAVRFARMREGDLRCPVDPENPKRRLPQSRHWNALVGKTLDAAAATRAMQAGRLGMAVPAAADLPVETLATVASTMTKEAKAMVERGEAKDTAAAREAIVERVAVAADAVAAADETGTEAKATLVAAVSPAAADAVTDAAEAKATAAKESRATKRRIDAGETMEINPSDPGSVADAMFALLSDHGHHEALALAMSERVITATMLAFATACSKRAAAMAEAAG